MLVPHPSISLQIPEVGGRKEGRVPEGSTGFAGLAEVEAELPQRGGEGVAGCHCHCCGCGCGCSCDCGCDCHSLFGLVWLVGGGGRAAGKDKIGFRVTVHFLI